MACFVVMSIIGSGGGEKIGATSLEKEESKNLFFLAGVTADDRAVVGLLFKRYRPSAKD